MAEFTVIAYEKEDGESPVEDFINGFVKKTQKTPPEEIRLAKLISKMVQGRVHEILN